MDTPTPRLGKRTERAKSTTSLSSILPKESQKYLTTVKSGKSKPGSCEDEGAQEESTLEQHMAIFRNFLKPEKYDDKTQKVIDMLKTSIYTVETLMVTCLFCWSEEELYDILLNIARSERYSIWIIRHAIAKYIETGFLEKNPSITLLSKLADLLEVIGDRHIKNALREKLWEHVHFGQKVKRALRPPSMKEPFSAKEIAHAIYSRDRIMLKSINYDELKNGIPDQNHVGLLSKIAYAFNQTAYIFAYEIIAEENIEKRREIISWMLDIGMELQKMGDIFGVQQINAAVAPHFMTRFLGEKVDHRVSILASFAPLTSPYKADQVLPSLISLIKEVRVQEENNMPIDHMAGKLAHILQAQSTCITEVATYPSLLSFFNDLPFISEETLAELSSFIKSGKHDEQEAYNTCSCEELTSSNLRFLFSSHGKDEYRKELLLGGISSGSDLSKLYCQCDYMKTEKIIFKNLKSVADRPPSITACGECKRDSQAKIRALESIPNLEAIKKEIKNINTCDKCREGFDELKSQIFEEISPRFECRCSYEHKLKILQLFLPLDKQMIKAVLKNEVGHVVRFKSKASSELLLTRRKSKGGKTPGLASSDSGRRPSVTKRSSKDDSSNSHERSLGEGSGDGAGIIAPMPSVESPRGDNSTHELTWGVGNMKDNDVIKFKPKSPAKEINWDEDETTGGDNLAVDSLPKVTKSQAVNQAGHAPLGDLAVNTAVFKIAKPANRTGRVVKDNTAADTTFKKAKPANPIRRATAESKNNSKKTNLETETEQ
jgi:hypothetical protein